LLFFALLYALSPSTIDLQISATLVNTNIGGCTALLTTLDELSGAYTETELTWTIGLLHTATTALAASLPKRDLLPVIQLGHDPTLSTTFSCSEELRARHTNAQLLQILAMNMESQRAHKWEKKRKHLQISTEVF